MQPVITDFSVLARRMTILEQYAVEVLLSLSSLWAARVLLSGATWPDLICTKSPLVIAAYLGSETQWGCVALIAAAAKLVGVSLDFTRFRSTALVLRVIGIAFSGVLWFFLGVSALHGNPASLFGFPVAQLGLSTWWLLVRLPTLPTDPSPSQ
jgi:hypothetical protein